MKKSLKIFIALSYAILILSVIFSTFVYADTAIDNPSFFEPSGGSTPTDVTTKAGTIFGLLQTVSVVISAIVIIILGIRYLVGSVEQRAEYKKSMIPYIVGVVLLVSITSILRGINSLVNQSIPE